MIEFEMIFALGFLAASLLALLGLPLVSRRARRLALATLERRMPLSQAEIAAQRDQRRAAHAVEVRQLELRIEARDARLGAAMAETGRHTTRIVDLETRRDADGATIANLQATLAELRQHAAEAEATATSQAGRLAALQDSHATDAATIARLTAALTDAQRRASEAAAAHEADLDSNRSSSAQTIQRLEAALAEAQRRATEAEATLAAQAIALHEALAVAAQHGDQARSAAARLSAAEALAEDQRTMLAELEKQLIGQINLAGRSWTERAPPEPLTDDGVQLRAALTRLRTDQDILQRGLATVTDERDRLRFRLDELLLQIEDLQDRAEEAVEQGHADPRATARQQATVAALTGELAGRDAEPASARQRLVDGGGLRASGAPTADAAALRKEIAALAAELVRFATGADAPPGS